MADVVARTHDFDHVERHQRKRTRVIGPWRWNARGDHVAIADRLDLLEAVALGKAVEVAEQVVEHADHLRRREALRPLREVHHVGEEDRGRAELVGDRLRLGLQSLGDRTRQDVEEQALGPGLLDPQRLEGIAALPREQRQQGEDHRPPGRDVEG
jgi:hypothetical protein